MICCEPTILNFSHVTRSIISYGGVLRAKHGPFPFISVMYWDFDQQKYIEAGIFTKIALSGNPVDYIIIDHINNVTGLIKIT